MLAAMLLGFLSLIRQQQSERMADPHTAIIFEITPIYGRKSTGLEQYHDSPATAVHLTRLRIGDDFVALHQPSP